MKLTENHLNIWMTRAEDGDGNYAIAIALVRVAVAIESNDARILDHDRREIERAADGDKQALASVLKKAKATEQKEQEND